MMGYRQEHCHLWGQSLHEQKQLHKNVTKSSDEPGHAKYRPPKTSSTRLGLALLPYWVILGTKTSPSGYLIPAKMVSK